MREFLIIFYIFIFLIITLNIHSEIDEINELNLKLTDGVLTDSSVNTLLANINYALDNGLTDRAGELADYLDNHKPVNLPLNSELTIIKAIYSEGDKGRTKAYSMLKKIKSTISDEEKEQFIKFIQDISVTPIKRRMEITKMGLNPVDNLTKEYRITEIMDLQWSVNIIWLLKDMDSSSFMEAKNNLIAELDREREFSIDFINQSSPQISVERAKDEAFAGIIGWTSGDIIPGKLAHLIDDRMNIMGFSICIGHPITLKSLSRALKDLIDYSEPEIVKVLEFTEEDYTIYRSVARATASVKISISQIFTLLGLNPYRFKPFVPKAPIIEIEEKREKDKDLGL